MKILVRLVVIRNFTNNKIYQLMQEGYYLFDLDNKSFTSFIDNLTEDAIKSNSDYVIYKRGWEYYDK